MGPATLRRVFQIRREAQALLQRMETETAAQVAALIQGVLDRLMVEIETAPNVDALLRAVSQLLDYGARGGADLMAALATNTFDVSLVTALTTHGEMFGQSQRTLANLARTFDATYRRDLITAGHANWYRRLADSPLKPASALRDALIDVRVNGGSLRTAVRQMIAADPALDRLPLSQQAISTLARARAVIRTETTRLDNAVSVGFAEAAGVELFANLGVGDDRQSDVCHIACASKPRTIEGWRHFYFRGVYIGPPPRHVANCRDSLQGVPSRGYDPSDALLIQAGVLSEEEAAR